NGARRYDKHCLNLTKEQIKTKLDNGDPFVIRQNMPTEGSTTYHDCVYGDITVANSELEDQILIKSDGMPTYNFANVVDDHLMAINCVMRGNEYLSSTPKYNLLYDSFGWEKPMYIHMPVIMRDAQHKLSKRNGDAAYSDFIEKGYLREAVLNYIALLGWSPKNNQEKMSLIEMENLFSIEGINKSPAIFDPMKMNWLNGLYIKEMDFDAFMDYAMPFIQKTKVAGKYDMVKLCKLLQGRIEFFGEIGEKVDFLEEFGEYDTELYINQKQKSDKEIAFTVLPHVLETLKNVETWENSALYEALKNLAVSLNLKNSQILWPTRIALSGRDSTPGGATELAELIGKDETIKRLKFSIELLSK
ncbi:MAG: glutamate--tRNA ligase, partial [Clostridia bacterium]|nr:glutamate--tRNA ligase [Clostridia bacterium]